VVLAFYKGQGGAPRRGGRLDERLRREIKGGEMKARLYGARWPGIGGGAGELGRLEVGDETDIWGLVDTETWERRPARKA
jgi:hypothetical protein